MEQNEQWFYSKTEHPEFNFSQLVLYADKYLKESITTLLFWCVGRMVKLSPFHGDDVGSIPTRII